MKLTQADRIVSAAVLVLLLCGCATQEPARPLLSWSQQEKRIIIFPPDVAESLITTSGAAEPRADRTQSTRAYLLSNLSANLGKKGIATTTLENLTDPNEIGASKYYSVYSEEPPAGAPDAAPAAKPDTPALRDRYRADYALFFHLHDFSTSTGREVLRAGTHVVTAVATAAVSLAASGGTLFFMDTAAPSGSKRIAVVSIVDLHTGAVVWSETKLDTEGDMWDESDNRDFVNVILKKAPF